MGLMQAFEAEDLPRTQDPGSLSSAGARAVFDTLGEGLIIWGENGEILDCNRSAAEILGRPWSELRSMSFDEVMAKAESEMEPVSEEGHLIQALEYPAIQARRENQPVIGQV